jgi:hypothetical protein
MVKMTNFGPYARIVARYGSSALVTYGVLSENAGSRIGADPDVIVVIGALMGVAAELLYARARRTGRPT